MGSLAENSGTRLELGPIALERPDLDGELREPVERIVVRRGNGIPGAVLEVDRTSDNALRRKADVASTGVGRLREVRGNAARLHERKRAFAQVPDTDITFVPHVLCVDRRRIARASETVVGGYHSALHELRHLHPNGRDAVRVPRVDLVGNKVAVRVREAEVSAVQQRKVGVAEAVNFC